MLVKGLKDKSRGVSALGEVGWTALLAAGGGKQGELTQGWGLTYPDTENLDGGRLPGPALERALFHKGPLSLERN